MRSASGDAELMAAVADGSAAALGELHGRYARTVFRLAAHTLDRAAAEDLVQDVFFALWRNAAAFDPTRGTVRAWLLQIAHFRLLNELRRRSRRPDLAPDPDGRLVAATPASDPAPDEATWRGHRRAALRTALEGLPKPQREALGLAFGDDLTHAQVAAELGVPLGTAKTRIRAAIQKLRAALPAHVAAFGGLCLLAALGVRAWSEHALLARYDRALTMVTASDALDVRLSAAPGTDAETHARYRARPGTAVAVVTRAAFPPAPAGETYAVWVRHGATWTSLGTVAPDATGRGRLIAEDGVVAAPPDAVQVTLEPHPASAAPRGRVVVASGP